MRKTYENVCGKAHFLYVPYQKGEKWEKDFGKRDILCNFVTN